MFGTSQNFGYAGDSAAPTQEAPKRAKQEEKQTCIPVTVRVLQDAVARHAESQEVLIHGVEASIVHIVGVVEALVQQAAMTEFTINDASGRMKVRYYTSSGTGSVDVPGLAAGRYVSVVGNLRTSPSAHISAMSLQAVTGADDVSYHMIEVAHAALRLRNPTKAPAMSAAEPITPAKQGLGLGFGSVASTVSPMKIDAPVAMSAPAGMQTPVKVDLRTSVVNALKAVQESAGEEGISAAGLVGRLAGVDAASSAKVKEVLAQLVDEGDVFTTIDDDHFAIV